MWKDLLITGFPIAMTSLCGYIVWMLKEDRAERKANLQGTKEILGYMLDRLFDEIMIQGYATTDQYDLFNSVYNSYHDLKGNGTRTHKFEQVKKMEIKNIQGLSVYAQAYLDRKKKENENE